MPSIEWNLNAWTNDGNWTTQGDEWSSGYGGPVAQWNFCLLPRIRKYLPVATILEIAPGYGRWTRFLREHCHRLIGVDISEKCVDACQSRFGGDSSASFFVNDGFSLEMIDSASVDFAFSFDSLVHAEMDVIAAYLAELARVLTPTGAAFIHHSNLGAFPGQVNWHGRATSVSGEDVLAECRRLGLFVASQERVNWACDELSDSMTAITRMSAQTEILDNPAFACEASHIAAVARLY